MHGLVLLTTVCIFPQISTLFSILAAVHGEVLNQGDPVHIFINRTSYPEALISDIATLSYSAALPVVAETWSLTPLSLVTS